MMCSLQHSRSIDFGGYNDYNSRERHTPALREALKEIASREYWEHSTSHPHLSQVVDGE